MSVHSPSRRLTLILSTILLSLALPVAAQDSFSIDEDDLFGTDEDVVVSVDETAQGSALKSLLTSESVTVGGRFSGSASADFTWDDPWEGSFDLTKPDDYGLKPALSALLYFDGRPSETTRFYGSVKSSWPFMTSTSVLTSATLSAGPILKTEATTLSIPKIEVFELFSDFSWNDSLYFRFGKQTVNWGVGYFFSPANILNLQAIDPNDPTAQLEGPVALRAHYPIPGSQHNVWAYTVFDSATMKPEETAAALKAEFVVGRWELGIGGYFKKDDPLRGMLTATGSIRDVSLFGEATLARGTKRTWVSEVPSSLPGFVTTTNRDDFNETFFFQGTAGFMYSNSEANISVLGQYLYDGEGYSNTDRKARITEARDNETAIKGFLAENPDLDVDAAFSGFLKGLILNSGRHYAAASFSKNKLFTDDLSFSLFAMGNLSDFSAYIKPSLSYSFFKGMSTSLSAFFALGFDDGEYVVLNDGRAMGLTVAMTLGSGSF